MSGLTNITLNGTNAVSVRLFIPYKGVWYADIDLDPEIAAAFIPSGPALLIIGTTTFIGTIDSKASGRFVAGVRIRVVGGRGGWDSTVPFQHFTNTAQLLSTVVYAATASVVKEVVIDAIPQSFGTDFVRTTGPASRIFQDRDWHVDPITGTTFVGPRLPAIPDPSLEVLGFDPRENRIEAVCDVPIMPGTPLIDVSGNVPPRWDGVLMVADVEHVFSHEGNRATLWVTNSQVSRLISALTNLVRETSKGEYNRPYLYRVVAPAGSGKLSLAPVDILRGAPPVIPIPVWGPAGYSATYTPGTAFVVIFLNGDPTLPIVFSFDSTPPLTITVDAVTAVNVGVAALAVNLAGGAITLASGPFATGLLTALLGFASLVSVATTVPNIATAASALVTALAALPPPTTVKTKAT